MRRLDTAFRWSTFLTLVLASFCLAYTEEAYLPGIDPPTAMIAVVVLAGIAVAWRFRHRDRTEPHG